jgi:Flp pilus assembly secretin CpaC
MRCRLALITLTLLGSVAAYSQEIQRLPIASTPPTPKTITITPIQISFRAIELSRTKLRSTKFHPDQDLVFPDWKEKQPGNVVHDSVRIKPVIDAVLTGAGKVIAEPTMSVLADQPASYRSGGEIPLLKADGNPVLPVQFLHFGTLVDTRQTLLPGGELKLDFNLELSHRDRKLDRKQGNVIIPGIRRKRFASIATMKFDHTFVLNGTRQQRVESKKTRIPGLHEDTVVEIDTVVLITPTHAEAISP